jgi:hypothetical protein
MVAAITADLTAAIMQYSTEIRDAGLEPQETVLGRCSEY